MPALQPQRPTAHCRNGRAALIGPHLGTVGRGQYGDFGGAERKRRPELGQVNVAVACTRRRRLPGRTRRLARYLALVVNELLTAGARPSNGREAELGSPYIKYKGSLAHFGCISTVALTAAALAPHRVRSLVLIASIGPGAVTG